jgi:hypothetical protein
VARRRQHLAGNPPSAQRGNSFPHITDPDRQQVQECRQKIAGNEPFGAPSAIQDRQAGCAQFYTLQGIRCATFESSVLFSCVVGNRVGNVVVRFTSSGGTCKGAVGWTWGTEGLSSLDPGQDRERRGVIPARCTEGCIGSGRCGGCTGKPVPASRMSIEWKFGPRCG